MQRNLWLGTIAVALGLLGACGGPAEQSAAIPGPSDADQKAMDATARLNASEGGKLVLRAIDAHGGLKAWYEAPTSSYCWEYSNVGANMRFNSCLTADNNTRRVYHDLKTLGTPEDPEPFEGRFAWDGEQAWIFPADTPKINPRFWALTGYYFEQIPFVLADPGLNYEVLPEADLDGVAHDMVKVSFNQGVGDAPGDTYTLYLNKDSGVVDAIRYTVTYYSQGRPAKKAKKSGGPRETLFYYENLKEVDGLKVATRFRGFDFVNGEKGEFKNEAWCNEISFRAPFDESRLAMPEGGRVEPMSAE